MNEGLTSDEWKEFDDLMIKANVHQIAVMRDILDKEYIRRFEILMKIS